jgi:glycosyltransferase XagB
MAAVDSILVSLVAVVLGCVAALTAAWTVYAWRSPAGLGRTRFRSVPETVEKRLRFSLIVPARHEDEVLAATLDGLAAMRYPDMEVLCVVGHDDPGTAAVATRASDRYPDRIRVVTDYSWPKSKPKALQSALPECTGDVIGVFDAEDEVSPDLLAAVEAVFHRDQADVVQGGVQLMNLHSSWWALRNVLEYYFWFRSRLHYHADAGFIPLGGNTVFVRADLLREVGGWDAECLAEDCELGVRLSVRGARVSVAYEPALATREETPGSIGALVKQRTRWHQGFLQVLRKGVWRQLPGRRRRLLAWYTLTSPFMQALTGLLVPISVLLSLVSDTPAPVTLASFCPLLLVLGTVALEAVALYEFHLDFNVRVGPRDYIRLVLGAFPYQWLLAAAALRAVWRELRQERGWEKTAHSNLHRPATDVPSALVTEEHEPVGVRQ